MANPEKYMEEENSEKWQLEIAAYKELLKLINISDFKPSEKRALAFITKDSIQTVTGESFVDLKNKFDTIKKEATISELTWQLAREFNNRYVAFLQRQGIEETNEVRKRNIGILVESLSRAMEIRKQAYESGKRVPIGGVASEHVPKWFRLV